MTCIEGELEVTDDRGNQITLRAGESCLVPAMATLIELKGNGVLINSFNEAV